MATTIPISCKAISPAIERQGARHPTQLVISLVEEKRFLDDIGDGRSLVEPISASEFPANRGKEHRISQFFRALLRLEAPKSPMISRLLSQIPYVTGIFYVDQGFVGWTHPVKRRKAGAR
jgi:hypothetical protein